jgi:hypothetical protein
LLSLFGFCVDEERIEKGISEKEGNKLGVLDGFLLFATTLLSRFRVLFVLFWKS